MRLIDADKLESINFSECMDSMEIMSIIDLQPTVIEMGDWITDRTPCEPGNYYVTIDTVERGKVDTDILEWDGESFNTFSNVYAWMPIHLPKPYSNV